jgi:hypothetical protein
MENNKNEIHDANKRFCLTLGVLEGGGSILGFDLEIPFSKIISLQGGAGLFGYGAGIDIHLRPTMRSFHSNIGIRELLKHILKACWDPHLFFVVGNGSLPSWDSGLHLIKDQDFPKITNNLQSC